MTDNPLTQLHHFIVGHYSLEKVRTLCFSLGVNYDDLLGQTLSGKARELILHLGRQRQLDQLLAWCGQTRPAAPGLPTDLDALYAALPSFEDTTLPAPPAPGESPFKGLQYFDVEDAHLRAFGYHQQGGSRGGARGPDPRVVHAARLAG